MWELLWPAFVLLYRRTRNEGKSKDWKAPESILKRPKGYVSFWEALNPKALLGWNPKTPFYVWIFPLLLHPNPNFYPRLYYLSILRPPKTLNRTRFLFPLIIASQLFTRVSLIICRWFFFFFLHDYVFLIGMFLVLCDCFSLKWLGKLWWSVFSLTRSFHFFVFRTFFKGRVPWKSRILNLGSDSY